MTVEEYEICVPVVSDSIQIVQQNMPGEVA